MNRVWRGVRGSEREEVKRRLVRSRSGSDSEDDDESAGAAADAHRQPHRWNTPRAAGLALTLLAVTAGASVLRARSGKASTNLQESGWLFTAQPGRLPVAIVASNEYPPVDTRLYPWKKVVEPHRVTRLTATGLDSSKTVRWAVVPLQDEGESESALLAAAATTGGLVEVLSPSGGESRNFVNVIFKQAARQYQVTAMFTSASGREVTLSETVMCKYVRRELRQLSAADRERFLSALELVHRLPLAEGTRRYGTAFTNFEQQVVKHLGSMTLEGYSRFHNGQVFLTAHFAFTLELEQALQAVDPSVALPYWDYTIDGVAYGSGWQDASPIFTDDFMGAYPNPAASAAGAVMPAGRWAWLPVPSDFSQPEHNAYGRLTDSINPDPAEYVGRARGMCGLETRASLPACKELWGVLAADNLDRLQPRVEYGYHGMLHAAVGGYWDCAYDVGELAKEHPSWARTLEAIALQANTLWRGAAVRRSIDCPKGPCAAGDPIERCSCFCGWLDALSDEELTYGDAYEFLDAASAIEMLANNPWLSGLAGMVDSADVGVAELLFGTENAAAAAPAAGGQAGDSAAAAAAAMAPPGVPPEQVGGNGNGIAVVAEAKQSVRPVNERGGEDGERRRRRRLQQRQQQQRRRRLIPSPKGGGADSGEVLWFYDLSVEENVQITKWLARFVAHPGKMAPFATPLAAPNDPLFGPSHSAYLRLLGYMTLTGHLDTSWTDDAGNGKFEGHAVDDELPFAGLFRGDRKMSFGPGAAAAAAAAAAESRSRGFAGAAVGAASNSEAAVTGGYTNRQLLEMMHPANLRLPYLWADFDWSHCPADDIPDGDRAEGPPRDGRR